MKPLRIGVVCDLREEEWHSMDLIADMLLEHLPAVAAGEIEATRLCPPMTHRWSRLPLVGSGARARLGDRLTGRLWDYPRWLAPLSRDFDLFHIIDHSYAHLVRVLPAQRTMVNCHDLDAVQAALPAGAAPFAPSRFLASGILDGLARAAHVACVSHATSDELLATGRVTPDRVSVVHAGVHPSCVPASAGDPTPGERFLLHVGSTIPRKRIDLLLRIFQGVRRKFPELKLRRVGGVLTPEQRALATELGVAEAILETEHLTRPALAACYRSARLVVLPSEREGFGLPLVEAMACGTPVVASDIPALKEVGGSAAVFCPVGDIDRWVETISALLREEEHEPSAFEIRRQASIANAARFNWNSYALEMTRLYVSLHERQLATA
ncbi:MAG: glycosyltransferase family 4 protein [Vicinamibacterales bacterium]|nr:glycosyltransferase family 4 protein [Vicinamibacterales bacterium]